MNIESGEPKVNYGSVESPESYVELIQKVQDEIEKMNMPDTVLPAARIMLFNFFKKNSNHTEEDLEVQKSKIKALLSKEELYKSNPKIPTIGTELEFDGYWIDLKRNECDTLNVLGIPNDKEKGYTYLHEVAQNFSYSSHVQMRVLQELRTMRLVSFEDEDDPMSLHLNLGLPKDVTRESVLSNPAYKTELFINTAVIAFCSIDRIRSRKSTLSNLVKKKQVVRNEKTGIFRFEIKPFAFENNTAFRMIDEMQMLCTSLFASIRLRLDNTELDSTDKALSDFWKAFVMECENLLNEYVKQPANMFSMRSILDKSLITLLIERNPDLVEKARALITSYSNMIKELLFRGKDSE